MAPLQAASGPATATIAPAATKKDEAPRLLRRVISALVVRSMPEIGSRFRQRRIA
jgi:hypothetical protein